ncbi:MAG TPA: hypothetical protein VEV87_03175, partial [Chitinophagaceae bacterium]|nr:hypothetical protein [Chitinophagaceae bacterium]
SFFNNIVATRPNEVEILKEVFAEHRVFKIYFSGKDEWIVPSAIETISIVPSGSNYLVNIKVNLDPEKPAVTFFDKKKLKEDLETKLPVAKIEIDNEIKIVYDPGNPTVDCCFENCPSNKKQYISLYQFFRNLSIVRDDDTKIDVTVCGLKNFIVQNDENVLNVNDPIYPFGTRPTIVDFNVVNPVDPPLATPNLIGPNFYLGSKEIFFKNWRDLCINLNWKDKPSNFNEYYKAYLKRDNYHDCSDPTDNTKSISGLNECEFEVNLALLEKGNWVPEPINRQLFNPGVCTSVCANPPFTKDFTHSFSVTHTNFSGNTEFANIESELTRFEVDSRQGFLRFNLRNQDFLHKDYAFVLGRQMIAMGKFPEKGVEGAVYYGTGNSVIVFKDTGTQIVSLETDISDTRNFTATTNNIVIDIDESITEARAQGTLSITDAEFNDPNLVAGNDSLANLIPAAVSSAQDAADSADAANTKVTLLKNNLNIFDSSGQLSEDLSVPIPNEPWTPIIKNMELDYTATASTTDIELVHLYPYENTFKDEELELQPPLFPTHCDEGVLFIGLKELVPGTNLNILFQLAEATADSETDPAEIFWYYLASNQWRPLRSGFEVLKDETNNLTTSGIIRFFIPGNITNDNTILPRNLHWIKGAAAENVIAVSETIGIHTQAMRATFNIAPANDQLRLDAPLDAKKLSKLQVPDANIKKVEQPYETFDGRVPEAEGYYYIRVSEWLRHKGRGIQKFDYERLVLDAFPQVFKVKCINHEFGLNANLYRLDVNAAPGYVVIAVIPDLNKLKSGQSFEPKVPLSLLEKITEYLRKRTSPFARIRVMNPRYEKIDICLTVQLIKGKDKVYYKNQLEYDLRLFLAPWAVGNYDKLSFGQCVNRSDIVRFIEGRDYVDYIICLRLSFEEECGAGMTSNVNEICPLTPRSILIGGNIDVCIPALDDCEDWKNVPDECSKSFDVTTVECAPEQPPIG